MTAARAHRQTLPEEPELLPAAVNVTVGAGGVGVAFEAPAGRPDPELTSWPERRSTSGDQTADTARQHYVPSRSASSDDDIDRKLLRRIGYADRDAFRQLYLRYHLRLSRFLVRVMGCGGDAEDAVNEALLIVWQRASDFRGDSRVSTWIFGISYRCALTSIRRRVMRSRVAALEFQGSATVIEDSAQETEDRQILEQGLARLPIAQRLVLVLAYYLDCSCDEIAAIVGCPTNTVKTRMFNARHKLRDFLSADNYR